MLGWAAQRNKSALLLLRWRSLRPDFGLTGRGCLPYSVPLRSMLRRPSPFLVARRQSASFAHWRFLCVSNVL
jgi:hypothetical protein